MEGNVYEHFPNFPRRVNDALRSIYGDRVDHINVGVSIYVRPFKTSTHFVLIDYARW
jgi:hypothetical protein